MISFLTGLIGNGIGASGSPALHQAEADAQGIRLVYTILDLAARGEGAESLAATLDAAERVGFAGVNVTHPYKQAVIAHLDALSDDAERIGAVNTVSFAGGKRTGYNTDVTGFAENILRGLDGAPLRSVVQMGAGGAGAATAHALMRLGVAQLTLHDADRARAQDLIDRLNAVYGEDRVTLGTKLAQSLDTADGVVNATPMGMVPYPGTSVPANLLRANLWVADIVYVPAETDLLRLARARGCRTVDGRGMVVFQAADAFEIFTGLAANKERMLARFLAEYR
ncbi:shikimate dehydrogenase [Sphingomonas sp. PB4P5]|uniref:shikimate dehydrogenase n=1 Tax=Parasphingomonas puruogangriensis TaxID=3096155 RepID=UPI002FCC02F0